MDIKQLKSVFEKLGYVPNTGRIAFEELANTLITTERLIYVMEGNCKSTVGLLVATDIRVLFVGCSPLKRSVIEKFSYEAIASNEFSESIYSVAGTIRVQSSGKSIVVEGCDPKESVKFIDTVKQIITDRNINNGNISDSKS
jgi:hypothetical protein